MPEADIVRAEGLAGQALAAAPRSGHAHYAKGQVLRAQRRFAEAIPEYETVLAFDPNWVMALFCIGQCKIYTGSIDETIPLTERAMRLFVPDSPLEGDGFELSVPRQKDSVFEAPSQNYKRIWTLVLATSNR
jgi:tetratricopeptide (TPR) repeat protein